MSVPLVPVIVTVYVAAVAELHVSVAVPELVIVLGVIAPHVRPLGTVSVRVTVPVKPLTAVTVIVEDRFAPVVPDGEVAATVKSVTVNVAVVECTSVPLVPVTVSEYVPAVVDWQDTVAVPEPVTLVGEIAPQVRPLGTVSVRLTVPVNPLIAVTVIVEVADVLMTTAAGDVATIVKSVTVKVAVAVWTSVPLVPVTVRV